MHLSEGEQDSWLLSLRSTAAKWVKPSPAVAPTEKFLARNPRGLAQSALIAAAFSPEFQVGLMGAMNGGIPTHETHVMPANREREAFEYATRLCKRLPRCLQECRECAHLSRYGLQKGCGVSRDMVGDVEHAESVPTLFVMARIAYGLGMTLTEFVEKWESSPPAPREEDEAGPEP